MHSCFRRAIPAELLVLDSRPKSISPGSPAERDALKSPLLNDSIRIISKKQTEIDRLFGHLKVFHEIHSTAALPSRDRKGPEQPIGFPDYKNQKQSVGNSHENKSIGFDKSNN
jgi:hypothetical protein